MLQAAAHHIPLHIYNAYRLLITSILLGLYNLNLHPQFFGSVNSKLFFMTLSFYWLASLSFLYWGRFTKTGQKTHIFSSIIIDVFALTLIMHASGGMESGFGILLVVVVAAAAVLVPTRFVYMVAAIASITLIAEYGSTLWLIPERASTATQTGLLGCALFVVAYLIRHLAIRVSRSEQAAASLSALSEQIIDVIEIGVVVFDERQNVILKNEAAQALLGLAPEANTLADFPKDFQAPYKQGSAPSTDAGYRINFYAVPPNTLVILHDVSEEARHAQQVRLAALGQMASNIAHEIRNPLGAIDHASQLLSELRGLPGEAPKLINIMTSHCRRTNQVIENILHLSRQHPPEPESLRLDTWLPVALSYLKESKHAIEINSPPLTTYVDPSRLQQILVNLTENGLRYSEQVSVSVREEAEGIAINVIDRGSGIAPDVAEHIFDPFYTTAASGTGLGLYLAKALCETAQIQLYYVGDAHPGAHFRVIVPKDR